MLFTKAHYDLLDAFERDYARHGRLDREPKELWSRGAIYQDGTVNALFLAYRLGYSFGVAIEATQPTTAEAKA